MKQRVEVAKAVLRDVPTLVATDPGTNVVAVKTGDVTWSDKVKEYYHAIFAAVSGALVVILTIVPALDPALALIPDPKLRGYIAIGLLVANTALTRLKSNQLWVPAPPATLPPTPSVD